MSNEPKPLESLSDEALSNEYALASLYRDELSIEVARRVSVVNLEATADLLMIAQIKINRAAAKGALDASLVEANAQQIYNAACRLLALFESEPDQRPAMSRSEDYKLTS